MFTCASPHFRLPVFLRSFPAALSKVPPATHFCSFSSGTTTRVPVSFPSFIIIIFFFYSLSPPSWLLSNIPAMITYVLFRLQGLMHTCRPIHPRLAVSSSSRSCITSLTFPSCLSSNIPAATKLCPIFFSWPSASIFTNLSSLRYNLFLFLPSYTPVPSFFVYYKSYNPFESFLLPPNSGSSLLQKPRRPCLSFSSLLNYILASLFSLFVVSLSLH